MYQDFREAKHTGSTRGSRRLTYSTPSPSCGSPSLAALRVSRAATCASPVLRCEGARLGTFVGPIAVCGRACSYGSAPALRTCRTVEMTLCAFCSIDTAVPTVATLTVYFTGACSLPSSSCTSSPSRHTCRCASKLASRRCCRPNLLRKLADSRCKRRVVDRRILANEPRNHAHLPRVCTSRVRRSLGRAR